MEFIAHKFSGLGNEILIIDFLSQNGEIHEEDVIKISKKNNINFDQLITILPPTNPITDLKVDIFNRDGSMAENCVNGARCLAKYVKDNGLLTKKFFLVETSGGEWRISSRKKKEYSVELSSVNISNDNDSFSTKKNKVKLKLEEEIIDLNLISLGNPHAVVFLKNIKEAPLDSWGKSLQKNTLFPNGINLGIAKIISPKELNLRVYERGVGETESCGSGACAAVISGYNEKVLQNRVKVNFKQGSININYDKDLNVLEASGGAEFINKLRLKA